MNEWKESDWFNLWLALAREKLDERTEFSVNRNTSHPGGDASDSVPTPEWEVTE